MGNLLVAQSGGPTAAINATLAGVIAQAKIQSEVQTIYGGRWGIEGIIKEQIIDLGNMVRNTTDLNRLLRTPAAALGSCRYKLTAPEVDDSQCAALINLFRRYGITWFIYIGGNDSMDTADKLSRYCQANNIRDIQIVGAPKTIDNDLTGIDHCPGFPSAARYIAATIAELERDTSVYNAFGVTIVEIMGRNTGWLTAASALARVTGSQGPDLIYLCEKPFSREQFIQDIKARKTDNRNLLVVVSEGLKDENGSYLTENTAANHVDVFGHQDIAGTGTLLKNLVREQLGCKVRAIELNLMQRCAAHLASSVDLEESRMLGQKAVQCALNGNSGVMVTLLRNDDTNYGIHFSQIPVATVANQEKTVPLDWISADGCDVTEEMMNYLKPLVDLDETEYFVIE